MYVLSFKNAFHLFDIDKWLNIKRANNNLTKKLI